MLETSDNLATWQPHSTNQVQYGLLEVAPPVVPGVSSATTYYRFRLLPD